MGVVWPGMTRDEALRRLKGRLPSPRVNGNRLEWDMAGSALIRPAFEGLPPEHYMRWRAVLHFRKGYLDWIDIGCTD